MSKLFEEWIETKEREDEANRYASIVNQNTQSDLQVTELLQNNRKYVPVNRDVAPEFLNLTKRVQRDTIFHKLARGINVLFRKPKKVTDVRLRNAVVSTKYLKHRQLIQVHINLDLDFMRRCR